MTATVTEVPARQSSADVYVRHAMPETRIGTDPADWELGGTGRMAALDLAQQLSVESPVAAVLTSPSPKAVGTAEAIARRFVLPVVADDRLIEAVRPWVGDGYRSLAHRYLSGDEPDGWECRRAVAARVGEAIAEVQDQRRGAVVVVTHGLALALHLGSLLPGGFDPVEFWSRLAFPDAWSVDAGELVLNRALDRS